MKKLNTKAFIERENSHLLCRDGLIRTGRRCCVNNGASVLHETIKFIVCYVLKNRGLKFRTDIGFKNAIGQCDIFCLSNGKVYEIMNSEKPESIYKKAETYPTDEIIVIDAGKYKNKSVYEIYNEIMRKI